MPASVAENVMASHRRSVTLSKMNANMYTLWCDDKIRFKTNGKRNFKMRKPLLATTYYIGAENLLNKEIM